MNRTRFLASVLGLVALLGAAEVRSAAKDQQSRLVAFQQKAMKERKSQGLENNPQALYSKYPTPEITLVSVAGADSKELPTVQAGSELTLSFSGRFVQGSLAHADCWGVEVLSEKQVENRLEVRVRVAGTTLPGDCSVRIISPVSLATAREQAFRVVGKHRWELKLDNGTKARLTTTAQASSPDITGTSEWFDKGGKSLGTRPVKVTQTSEAYRVEVQRNEQETAATNKANEAASKEFSGADTQKQVDEIQQKIQNECMKLAGDKMGPCIKKYTAQMKALSDKTQAKVQEAQQKATATTVGCESLSLQASDGKVSGQGLNCGAPGEVNVTGTIAAAK